MKRIFLIGCFVIGLVFLCISVVPKIMSRYYSREAVEAHIQAVGETQFRQDALAIERSGTTAAARDSWPGSVRSLDPKEVRLSERGVFIVLQKIFTKEDGIFVPLQDSAEEMPSARGTKFEKAFGGIYFYKIGD